MNRPSEIGKQFVNLLTSPEGHQILAEVAETVLDRKLVAGIVKDAPILSIYSNLIHVLGSIPDQILANKVHEFLTVSLDAIDTNSITKTISRLESDNEYGRRFGEHMIEQLARMDSHVKPTILARLFVAYAKEKINREEFLNLIHVTELIQIADLKVLKKHYEKSGYTGDDDPIVRLEIKNKISSHRLYTAGLILGDSGGYGIGVSYFPNEFGALYVANAFAKPNSEFSE